MNIIEKLGEHGAARALIDHLGQPNRNGKVRCLNGAAHRRGDEDPSMQVYAASASAHCFVCEQSYRLLDVVRIKRSLGTDSEAAAALEAEYCLGAESPSHSSVEPVSARVPDVIEAVPPSWGPPRHVYRAEDGDPVYAIWRWDSSDGKRIAQGRPDGNGGWLKKRTGVREVPYRLPELLSSPAHEPVLIAEGEKCVERLVAAGFVATCNPGGANAWPEHFATHFAGREVVVLPDNDTAGRSHAEKVAANVLPVAAAVRVLELAELPPKGDVDDWFDAGNDAPELRRLISEVAPCNSATVPDQAPESRSCGAPSSWPEMRGEAYIGLANDVVATLSPHSEADPAALLLTFLAMFGARVGGGPGMWADGSKHPARLFVVVAGRTSRARKGTSFAQIRRLFNTWDADWTGGAVASGLSSGEGLLRELSETETTGPANVLVYEPELARMLKSCQREGNILSSVLRDLWDRGSARNLTKKEPLRVDNAHVGIVAHITNEELARVLNATEIANGFANRFLFVCAKRWQRLPDGGSLSEDELRELARKVKSAVHEAGGIGDVCRDGEAAASWRELYEAIPDDVTGLVGAITARTEAHILRLSVVYALLDGSAIITRRHLEAAVAVWDYCEESARYLFGGGTGNPVADEIYRALESAGTLSRTDLHRRLGNHVLAAAMDRAIEELEGAGLVVSSREQTAGAPRQVLRLAKKANQANEGQSTEPASLSSLSSQRDSR